MEGLRLGLLLAVLAPGSMTSGARAQAITSSAAPENVAVTIYRDPHRSPDRGMQLNWLNGYALITETRRISIPAGDGVIRFEGVAGGILPESAIVTGLPAGVIEKNQDAFLLSPASLLDRSLGRRVHLRRTGPGGQVREHEAVIRSSASGAVVLQTGAGFEALRCSGIPETIVYDEIPEGLSAKPTLSVRTRSDRAASAIVTLSYLATGFDWQANYVATLTPAEDRMHLFAWVTLANGDETSFANADTQTVAGRLNREHWNVEKPRGEELHLQCWPSGTTSDIGLEEQDFGGPPPPPPPAPPPPPPAFAAEQIVVTGSRVQAVQEELGDLKLYRVPERVTVASNSQKQVAMLEKEAVRVRTVYRTAFYPGGGSKASPAQRVLVTRNRSAEGLGLPLPAGRLVLFASGRERPILIGEGSVDDRAIGEDVEIELGAATGVMTSLAEISEGQWELTVTSDRAAPVQFEAEIADQGGRFAPATRLSRRNGRALWQTTVPANGRAVLRYRFTPAG